MILDLYKTPNFITFGNVGSGRGVVSTVNGKTGEVELTTEDIPEAATQKYMTDAERAKLAGIEEGATAGAQNGSAIKTLYEAEPDTNALTDALKSKLDGVESGATADQDGSEIKSLYEAEADTNAFSDADKAKLDGLNVGGGGNVQADMGTTVPTDGSYILGMGTTGRAVAQIETDGELRALVAAESAFADIEEMLAFTGPANTDDIWRAGAFRYRVMDGSAANPHLTTAGGVKLWVLPTDDGVYHFDAFNPAADGTTDDYDALQRALTAEITGTGYYQSGPALFLANREYFIGQTINLKYSTRLFGNSSGMPSDNGALLIFPSDTTGIIINRFNTFGDGKETPPTTAADASIIEGIRLRSTIGTDITKHGIRLRARAVIRNVHIEGFSGDGINIVASSNGANNVEGNANSWHLQTLRIIQCGRSGVFVDGADANSGVAIGVDTSSNGRWGLCDSSFLGNTYVACHTANNGVSGQGGNATDESSLVSFGNIRYGAHPNASEAELVATTPGTDSNVWVQIETGGPTVNAPLWTAGKPQGTYFVGGNYLSDNLNARNLYLGCYAESGTAGSSFMGPALTLGGSIGQINQGSSVKGENGGGVDVASLNINNAAISAEFAGDVNNGDILKWSHVDDSSFWPWRLHRRGADFVIDNAASGARTAMYLTGENTNLTMGTSAPIPYMASFPKIGLGDGANTRRITYSTAAPTTGNAAQGDIVFNRLAAAGGQVGWVCVTAGSPGVWRGFGTISA